MGPLATASIPAGLRALSWGSVLPRFLAPGSLGGAGAGIGVSVLALAWLLIRVQRAAAIDAFVG